MTEDNSMEIARRDLDAKLAEKGYRHPDEKSQKQISQYQSYSETGVVYSPTTFDTYASFSDVPSTAKGPISSVCPKCDKIATFVCSCPLGDVMCSEGHFWRYDKNGRMIFGDPHAGED